MKYKKIVQKIWVIHTNYEKLHEIMKIIQEYSILSEFKIAPSQRFVYLIINCDEPFRIHKVLIILKLELGHPL